MKEYRKAVLLGFTVLLIVVGIYLPQSVMAKAIMSDEELGSVVGRGGISLTVDHLTTDTHVDTIYYGDSDGLGDGSQAGYISLTDVALKGSIVWASPVKVDVATANVGSSMIQVTSMKLSIPDAVVNIDRFEIDAIRLGSEPGVGNSLGSFGIYNLSARLTGNIEVQVH
jgi:hypothetical protein